MGIKGHTGYFACRRCCTEGKSVVLQGRVNKKGGPCQKVCYPELDAPARTSQDFKDYYDLIDSDPHVPIQSIGGNSGNENHGSDDFMSDDDDDDEDVARIRKGDPEDKSFWEHHNHPTILTKITFLYFNH